MNPVNINELRARAEAGEARAQYHLAASLSAQGANEEANLWLQKAAENGEPDAGYTLATQRLQSLAGAEEAVSLLTHASAAGSSSAKRLLGVLKAEGFGIEPDWGQALTLVVEAAKAGDVAAVRELAMLLLAVDENHPAGVTLLHTAASQDAIAGAVYVRCVAEGRENFDSALAKSIMQKLDSARYPNAEALSDAMKKAALPQSFTNHNSRNAEINWSEIKEQLQEPPLHRAKNTEQLSDEPDVKMYRGAFTPEQCEYIIASAASRLAPSQIFDPRSGLTRRDTYRTSLTATLGPVDLDLALVAIMAEMAHHTEQPRENGEFLSVLHYSPGQEYKPHFDWLPPGPDYERGGQRVSTALIYLNDGYTGGETVFLSPEIQVKGAVGDLLVFHNVQPDGQPNKSSRHASLPIKTGEKWLCSRWFREKKYNF